MREHLPVLARDQIQADFPASIEIVALDVGARNPATAAMEPLPATTFAWGKPDAKKWPGFESRGIWANTPLLATHSSTTQMAHSEYFSFNDFENHGLTDVLEKRVASAVVTNATVQPEAANPIAAGTMQSQYRYFRNNGNGNGTGFTEYAYKINTGEAFVVLDTADRVRLRFQPSGQRQQSDHHQAVCH